MYVEGSILNDAPVLAYGSLGLQADSLVLKSLESVMGLACGRSQAALITKEGEAFLLGKEKRGRLDHKINQDAHYWKIVEPLSDVNIHSVKCG